MANASPFHILSAVQMWIRNNDLDDIECHQSYSMTPYGEVIGSFLHKTGVHCYHILPILAMSASEWHKYDMDEIDDIFPDLCAHQWLVVGYGASEPKHHVIYDPRTGKAWNHSQLMFEAYEQKNPDPETHGMSHDEMLAAMGFDSEEYP